MDDEAPYKMAARNRAMMPGLVHAITNKGCGSSLTPALSRERRAAVPPQPPLRPEAALVGCSAILGSVAAWALRRRLHQPRQVQ
jgi:hypothetical protein